MRRSRPLIAVVSAAAAAATVLASATSANAATAHSTVNYVALGDSYSSGVGASSSYLNSCDDSTGAYPYLYDQATSPASFNFVACTGATTSDVESSQLSALSSSTTLVSITIGGNDVGFSSVMSTCIFSLDSGCVSAVDSAEQKAQNTLPSALDTLYSDIRADAPNAHVVVLGYPEFYDLSQSSSCIGLDSAKRTAINGGADVLNSAIATEVAKYGNFTYEDVVSHFSGHEICDSTAWIHSLTYPLDKSYHPTAAGQAGAMLPAFEAGI